MRVAATVLFHGGTTARLNGSPLALHFKGSLTTSESQSYPCVMMILKGCIGRKV
jgi:hypothetical protein